jgi:hypothetical protein
MKHRIKITSFMLKQIGLAIVVVAIILLIKEMVRFVFNSWLAFCVYYTMSDLYGKRKYALKYIKKTAKFVAPWFPNSTPKSRRATRVKCKDQSNHESSTANVRIEQLNGLKV